MATTRTASFTVMSFNSDSVHAASFNPRLHRFVLSCSGRAIQAMRMNDEPTEITCGSCNKGISGGRIAWAGEPNAQVAS